MNSFMRIDCTVGRHWCGACADIISIALQARSVLADAVHECMNHAGGGQAVAASATHTNTPRGYIWIPEVGTVVIEPGGRQGSIADDGAECVRVFEAITVHQSFIREVVRHWAETALRETLRQIEVDDADDPIDAENRLAGCPLRSENSSCEPVGPWSGVRAAA